ncbi:hypothetical protein V8E53_008744 [Lactarius tabidus]
MKFRMLQLPSICLSAIWSQGRNCTPPTEIWILVLVNDRGRRRSPDTFSQPTYKINPASAQYPRYPPTKPQQPSATLLQPRNYDGSRSKRVINSFVRLSQRIRNRTHTGCSAGAEDIRRTITPPSPVQYHEYRYHERNPPDVFDKGLTAREMADKDASKRRSYNNRYIAIWGRRIPMSIFGRKLSGRHQYIGEVLARAMW